MFITGHHTSKRSDLEYSSFFFFSSRRRHTRSVSAFLLNRSSDLNQSAAFSSGKVRPNHETNINIIARRTGKDVNSHTVLDGIITTIMATIQRINIIGSREGSRNRRRLKANQTGKRSEERFSRNAETDLVCRLLLEKKKTLHTLLEPRIGGLHGRLDRRQHARLPAFDREARRKSEGLCFFNDTRTTEIYTLSLHDALPILTV